ncbi:hypothetical protein [Maridesulfovibrio sp.]|uniref:hypothetical protein n=1 Tax=Maridesulfovibrio sp. TaxID=2795000 RepID=UPI0039F111E7
MDSKMLGCHVSDMMSACCSLSVLLDYFEKMDMMGEAFMIEAIRRTVSESANAFDEYDMKVQMAKKRNGKPAAVLRLVRE